MAPVHKMELLIFSGGNKTSRGDLPNLGMGINSKINSFHLVPSENRHEDINHMGFHPHTLPP